VCHSAIEMLAIRGGRVFTWAPDGGKEDLTSIPFEALYKTVTLPLAGFDDA